MTLIAVHTLLFIFGSLKAVTTAIASTAVKGQNRQEYSEAGM